MKNKNKNFGEQRMLWFSDLESAETTAQSPEDRAMSFIGVFHEFAHVPGGEFENDEGDTEFDPALVLENNPYAPYLVSLMENKLTTDEHLALSDVDESDGEMILVFMSPDLPDYKLSAKEMLALGWQSVAPKLEELFEGKNISPALIASSIASGSTQLETLAFIVLRGEEVTEDLLDEVVAEFEPIRTKLAPKKAADRTKMKGQIERGKLKDEIVDLPTESSLDNKVFIAQIDDRTAAKGLDRMKINIMREGIQMNPEHWDITTTSGMKEIYSDCRKVGIPVTDQFYSSMFSHLTNATDDTVNTYLDDPTHQSWFQDPARHMSDIKGLAALPTGFDPKAFAKSYEHLQYIQGMLEAQQAGHIDTLGKQEGADKDSIAEGATDFLKSNFTKFQQAIKDRDYATAGMYVVGIWAIYTSLKELGVLGKDGKGTKWLAYGLAAYCGHTFLKNAGYDVLKMSGFKDGDYEVKGTPMEVMDNILRANPSMREVAKDLDYGVVLKVSEVSLTDIHDLYKKSNKDGNNFIHPNQFPSIFPNLADVPSFEMGRAEHGLSDYTGMSHSKLSPSQKEYVRVGKQLYLIALSLKTVYADTLQKEHPEYKGIDYEKAIYDDDTRKLGKVRHLLDAVKEYAPEKPARRLMGVQAIEEARAHMDGAFSGKECGLNFDPQPNKHGHLTGKIMQYPIVVVRVGESYRFYLKNKYKPGEAPGPNYLAEVPIEAGSPRDLAVDKVLTGVKTRMLDLMAPLQGAGGKQLVSSSLSWKREEGAWTCEVELPGAAEFGIAARKTTAYIDPKKEGDGVFVKIEGGVTINVDEALGKRFPVHLALIPKIINEPKLNALKIFSNAGKLKIQDDLPGDKVVTILIGDNDIPLKLKYVGGSFEAVNPTRVEEIVGSSEFAAEYMKSLEGDGMFELNKTIEGLKRTITKSCDEDFVSHFFEALTQQTGSGPLKGFNSDMISGSVPDNFAEMVLNVSRREAFERMRRGILTVKTFEDVEKMRITILADYHHKLKGIKRSIEHENALNQGDGWDRDMFMTMVVDQIRNASCSSGAYSRSKAEFEYMVYGLNLPGVMNKSDAEKQSHNAAEKLMGVYVYYTAHLDNHKIKDPTTGKDVMISLDHIKYPATPTAGITDKTKDPALRGALILQYLEYVKESIYDRASSAPNLEIIPDGSAGGHWAIDSFEIWATNEGTYEPLDPLDSKEHLKHDVLHSSNDHTELDRYMGGEYDKVVSTLMAEYGGTLNYQAISDYLRKDYLNPDNTAVPINQIGLFTKHPLLDASGNVQNDASGNPIVTSKLWDISNRIATSAGRPMKRSVQITLVQQEMEKFINYVFSEAGRKKFFNTQPSYTARLLRKWPWLDPSTW